MAYKENIVRATENNSYFRKVLFTGEKSQLVVMDLKPGEDIGEEVHSHVEQTLFNLQGEGTVILDGVEAPFLPGDVVMVTPGVRHNFINTGSKPLKIYTIYVPANHIDGRVHETKAAAIADDEDEAFGASTH